MNRMWSRLLLLLALAVVALLSVMGCVYFELPRDQANRLLLTTIPWGTPHETPADALPQSLSHESIRREVRLDLRRWHSTSDECASAVDSMSVKDVGCWVRFEEEDASSRPQEEWTLSAEFLHISDAQIRDERAYDPWQLRWLDQVAKPTIRLPLMEALDSVVLASFLHAYRGHIESAEDSPKRHRFVVHTGDLLDISLVTELIEAGSILRAVVPDVPVFSVVGNHDGLTWGNLRDDRTTTWELGVNRKEFVLGNILFSPPNTMKGFGFGDNEIVKSLSSPNTPTQQKNAFPETIAALARVERIRRLSATEFDEASVLPLSVKGAINISQTEDTLHQLGYYNFERGGIEFVVLDTTARELLKGDIGDVQLGWLYQVLDDAVNSRRPVVLVAHHAPHDFARRSTFPWMGKSHARVTLERMVRKFPNILALFYGHGHKLHLGTVAGVPAIQVPSLVDYPQTGARVQIFTNTTDVAGPRRRVEVSFVRPYVLSEGPASAALSAALYETWVMSYFDDRDKNCERYGPEGALRLTLTETDGPLKDDIRWQLRSGELYIDVAAPTNWESPEPQEIFDPRLEAEVRQTRQELGLSTW